MYVKLFSSLYNGSLRGKSDCILVFTNMLAHADSQGIVDVHPRAISEETGLALENVLAAIKHLEAPDEDSRSPDEDGKRLILLDFHRNWGWQIVNFLKYRAIRNEEERREQNREAQRRWREKHGVISVSQDKPESADEKRVSRDKPMQKQKQKQKQIQKKKNKEEEGASCEWIVPENLDSAEVRTLLARFASMRSEKKKPIRDFSAASLVLQHFDDEEHLRYALEVCIANGYQGLKPDYRKPTANGKTAGKIDDYILKGD